MNVDHDKMDFLQMVLDSSPKEADIAIVSIDLNGSLGDLNQFVLKKYGYSELILNNLKLDKEFDLFQLNGKPILFVVTVFREGYSFS